jgi:hypothetical protein
MSWIRHSLILLLVVLCSAGPARAESSDEDKATARQLGTEAQAAMAAGDFQQAADLFERAEKLYHAPTLLLGLARASVKVGRFVRAREAYNLVVREPLPPDAPPAFVEAQQAAQAEIADVEGKIAWVTIKVTGPDKPVVRLDGQEVPVAALGVKRAVDPGEHTVEASAAGYSAGNAKFSVDSAGHEEVLLELEPGADTTGSGADEGAGDTQRLLGFVSLGVGGAGLIVGVITGALAMDKKSTLDDACPEARCPASEQDNLDSYHTVGTVSTVGFIAGGVLAVAGVVLVLTAPSGGDTADASEPSVTARLGFDGLTATVRY